MPMPYLVDLDDSDDDFGLNEVPFGTYRVLIVGIRYYKGRVNNNEMVSLKREPHNQYDANAIRVDNVFGVQVGHIKREQASVLARLIDRNHARLEGVVPFGMNNKFSMPCNITLWGDEQDKELVMFEMRRGGLHMDSQKASSYGSYESGSAKSSFGARGPMINAVKVSAHSMKRELDQLFEKLTETATAPSIKEPAEAIKTNLFQHQKQALSWMAACENVDGLPPFWEERGPNDFFNTTTNFSSPKRPPPMRGGILADDMGLGKTLEIISLIVTNFKNGKNLVTIDKTREIILNGNNEAVVPRKNPRKRASISKSKKENFQELFVENEDDLKMEADLPPLPSFTSKEDPDFQMAEEDIPPVEASVSKRPQRAAKKPARYTFDDVNDDGEGDEDMDQDKKANKKPKQRKRTSNKVKEEPVAKFPDVNVTNENPEVPEACHTQVKEELEKGDSFEIGNPANPHVDETIKTFESKKTKASGPRATLVICPLSVLSNWQEEISRHVWPGLLDVCTYYGSDRIRDSDVLAQKDIVLTTYQTLTVEASKKKDSPLLAAKWLRVVLDEGHCIRNPNALQTKTVHSLQAERRWVVTGTPIQNSMKDLWSIICFLKLDPFTEREWWRRVIERPIREGEKDALMRLQQLMKVIAMRRTKTQRGPDGKPIVDIPDKSVFVNYIELSPEERDVYKAVAEQGRVTIGKYMKAGTLMKNYTEVLVILTRLRQLCCHPKLCTAALEAAAKEAVMNSTPEELRKKLSTMLAMVISTDEECPVCLDFLDIPVITHCAHIYCRKCIENVIKVTSPNCPMCRGSISLDQLVDAPSDQQEEAMDTSEWNSSAKVDALLDALERQRQADPSVKCLVVSQFASYLRLLKQPLEGRGFQFVHLDGSLCQEKRAAAIREFSDTSPGSPKIFLLSLKAGGVGLNLTAASRVFLMDPAWNPAAEDQCFDRCHRLGQTRPVEIHKFIVKDSIEERMLEMQERKRQLMSGAFAKPKAEELRKQKIKDVTNLMNI